MRWCARKHRQRSGRPDGHCLRGEQRGQREARKTLEVVGAQLQGHCRTGPRPHSL
jgi:hypothetical protein